eukprot:scaffold41_cov90-Cyclotella_meneghiniana.AAC.1
MVMNRDIYASDRKAIKDMIAKKQTPPSSGALLSKLVQYERSNIFLYTMSGNRYATTKGVD